MIINSMEYAVGDYFQVDIDQHTFAYLAGFFKGKLVVNYLVSELSNSKIKFNRNELLFSNTIDRISKNVVGQKIFVDNSRRSGSKYYCTRGFDSRKKIVLEYNWAKRLQDVAQEVEQLEKTRSKSLKKNENIKTPKGRKRTIKIADDDDAMENTKKTTRKSPRIDKHGKIKKTKALREENRNSRSTSPSIVVMKPRSRSSKQKVEAVKKKVAVDKSIKKKNEGNEDEFMNSESENSLSEEDDFISDESEEEDESDSEVSSVSSEEDYRKRNRKVRKISPRKLKKAKFLSLQLEKRNIERELAESNFEKAEESLHVSAVPFVLPCRENEFATIYAQLESAIEQAEGTCLYIYGVPGTGKTATVKNIIRALQAQVEKDELSSFHFVELNGMKLSEPNQAYSQLWQQLTGSLASPHHAESLLSQYFTTPRPDKQPVVLLIDELDILVEKKQNVVYNFFDWPNHHHSRLVVVSIANTMDLPERMLSNKVSSRLGLSRIAFMPYKYPQLYTILESRLGNIIRFDPKALEFCARKIAAVSGDARRALDLCRRAIEFTQERSSGSDACVIEADIRRAFKDLFASPTHQALAHLTFHQRIFLTAVVRRIRKNGTGQIDYQTVVEEHFELCRLQNKIRPTYSQIASICFDLSQSHLIIAETGKSADPTQKLQVKDVKTS